MLVWLLENKYEKVHFKLELQPGPQEIREQAYEKTKNIPGVSKRNLSREWHTFLSETWINPEKYNVLDDEEIRQIISEKIDSFLERKGNAVADAIKEIGSK